MEDSCLLELRLQHRWGAEPLCLEHAELVADSGDEIIKTCMELSCLLWLRLQHKQSVEPWFKELVKVL